MKKFLITAATVLAFASGSAAQTVMTHPERDPDVVQMAALEEQEADGTLMSLPPDKLESAGVLTVRYVIRANFLDPDSARASILRGFHHIDTKVWMGLLGGGFIRLSGDALCASIAGKNANGGYVEATYLIVLTGNSYKALYSPYYDQFMQQMETSSVVTQECG